MIQNSPEFIKNNNRVVVFGKSGFIAKHLIVALKNENFKILPISSKKIDLLKSTSIKQIKSIINDSDTVVFTSAKAPVKNIQMFYDNITMIKNFIEATKNKKINHLIYISSDAVYSDSKNKINENSKTDPDSLHGMMHLIRENLLKSFQNNISIIRPTLIFGHNDPHNGYGPNKFVRLVNNSSNIILFGNGEEKRDHIWVEDLSKILIHVIRKRVLGKLNATTGSVISFNAIAKQVKKISNKNIKIISTDRVGKMPHNGYRAFDNSKIYKIIPKFKFRKFSKIIKQIINKY